MIARIIDSSIANRFFVVLAAIGLALAGFWAVRTTPVDALPDLSDVQVVIRSNYPGQAPRIVEDQVQPQRLDQRQETAITGCSAVVRT